MKDLIEALTILLKYGNPDNPTVCEHDSLIVVDEIDPGKVSKADIKRLDELGFHVTEQHGQKQFMSYRFGSA